MDLSAQVALYVSKPEFRRWMENPEEPRDWAQVAKFLGLSGVDADIKPVARVEQIRTAVRGAIEWCRAQDIDYFICGRNFGSPIPISDMESLLDFLVSLNYRFPESFRR